MKHKKFTLSRFTVMLVAIFSCIAMLFSAVFTSFFDYAENRAPFAWAEDGDGEGGSETTKNTYVLTSVTLTKNAGWIFTKETPNDALYKMVAVTVAYDNVKMNPVVEDKYVLEFTGATEAGSGAYIAESGEKVTFTQTPGADSTEVTVNVTLKPDAEFGADVTGETSATFSYEAEQRAQNGIVADYIKAVGKELGVTSSMSTNNNAFFTALNIYIIYNDGTKHPTPDTTEGNYILGDTFFPEDFAARAKSGNPYKDKDTYSKTLTVTTKDGSYSTTVLWEDITYEAPSSLGSMWIIGDLATQYARSELNLNGLTVQLIYGAFPKATQVNVALSAFKECLTITYYDSDDEEIEDLTTLTTAVKSVSIQLNYPGETWTASGYYDPITVAPLAIHVPQFPDMRDVTLAWNEGASIQIGNWDYNSLYPADKEARLSSPEITISAVNADIPGKAESITHTDLENPKNGIVTVNFLTAGVTYLLKVTLKSGDDFQWDTQPEHVNKDGNYVLQITVQVAKGKLNVELSDIEDSLVYGNRNGDGHLTAKIAESNPVITLPDKGWTLEEKANANDHVNDQKAWFYHLEYTDREKGTPVPDSELYSDASDPIKKPKNVGKYSVVAVTHENGGYLSATSAAVDFEITPFVIKTGIKNQEFDRKTYSLNDFLITDGLNTFPYGDTAKTILDFSDSLTFTTANAYTVDVSVKTTDNYSKNYLLQTKSGTASSTTLEFSITTYTQSSFKFKIEGWLYNSENAAPKITITERSNTYYPSYTSYPSVSGSTLAAVEQDFEIHYYDYSDGSQGKEITTSTYATFKEWPAGRYLAVLTAKAETREKDYQGRTVLSTENPQTAADTTVSYTLPVEEKEFSVTAAPIKAPYLKEETKWTFGSGDGEELHNYNAVAKVYELQNWIADNTAADGTPIITVSIQYALWTSGSSTKDATVSGKDVSIKNAGKYILTITLNGNYQWDLTGLPTSMSSLTATTLTYTFVGYISRQQITLLTDGSITGDTNVYNTKAQTKKITGWNDAGLKITQVSVASLGDGHTPISGGIAWYGDETAEGGKLAYGQFSVRNAGKYTVLVDIADPENYTWTGGSTSRLSLYYTLEQAVLQVQWEGNGGTTNTSGNYPKYQFNGTNGSEQMTPTATLNLQGDLADDIGKIKIDSYRYWAYNEGKPFTQEINQQLVNAKGFYYISVNRFSDKDSSNQAAANYKLSDPLDTMVGTIFEITAYLLDAPKNQDQSGLIAGTSIPVTYKGTAFDLNAFIGNYSDYEIGGKYRINAAVLTGGEAKNVKSYTIRISLTDSNFAWSENGVEYYDFTLVINALPVEIKWTKWEVTFAPALTAGGGYKTPDALYEITNIAPAGANDANKDKLSLVLGYKKGELPVALSEANAGEYTVYAADLTSTDGSHANYTLANAINPNHEFIIEKLAVDRFEVAEKDAVVNNFNGDSGSLPITALTNFVNADVQIVVTGRIPGGEQGWFTDEGGDVTLKDLPTLKFKDGVKAFNYERAGVYSFTVSLDATNYYWAETTNQRDFGNAVRYEYPLDDAFTVNPRTLTAPLMGYMEQGKFVSQRAQEFDKKPASKLEIKLSGEIEDSTLGNVQYNVQFGDVKNATELKDKWIGFNEFETEGVQGFYFALLTLKGVSSEKLLNYKWVANPGDPNSTGNGSGYLQDYRDVFVYIHKDGTATVTVKLYYAITRSQLPLELHVNDYEFGSNGQVDGDDPTASFDATAAITGDGTVYLTGDGLKDAVGDHAAKLKKGWKFLDKDGQEVTDLENGLPWTVGEYLLRGVLQFGTGSLYEDMPVEVSFKVYERTVSIQWSDLTVTYDHDSHMAGAKVTTKIFRLNEEGTAYDTTRNYAGGLTLTVLWKDHGTEKPVNAGEYTVIVDAIVGNDGNYTLPEARTETLHITAKTVKIGGKALVTEHVYGDVVKGSEITYDFLDGTAFCGDGAEGNLIVEVFKADKKTLYSRYDAVGDYYIIVRWNNLNSVHCSNYKVEFDTNATLKVVKRKLTVEWLTASGTYGAKGEDIELYQYLNVTYTNGAGGIADAFADKDKDKVITLTPAYALDKVPDAKTYLVTPTPVDPTNWDITFTNGTQWEYTINEATITASFTTHDGNYQAKNLTAVENEKHNILFPDADKNNAVWQYGFVKEGETAGAVTKWLPMTAQRTVEVYDAGTYYIFIKITAKNYNEFITENALKVVIARAELKVHFDFTIMYGEANPASLEHLFGKEAVRSGAGWKVTGFLGSDEDLFYNRTQSGNTFYELTGDGKYTIADFPTEWDWNHATALKTYAITYSGEALSCVNYFFTAEAGTLTIKQIEIKVTGKTVDVVYNTPFNEFPKYKDEGTGYTVEHPASTFNSDNKYTTDNARYQDLILVSSTAFKAQNSKPTTADVGDYELKIEGVTSKIYIVTVVDSGTVNVTEAELPAYVVTGYSEAYDELYHGLFVDGTSTVNSDGTWNADAFAKTNDETTVTTEFWRLGEAYPGTINDTVLAGMSQYKITDKEGPIYIDVGTHYIVYKISAGDNYTPIFGKQVIKITQAKNRLKDNTDFRFKDDDARVYSGGNFKDATDAAWIYGYGVDGGFDVNDRHVITNPEALYQRASESKTDLALRYRLYYSANGEGDGSLLSTFEGDYKNVTTLFAELFKSSGVFNAGYYRLEVFMSFGEVTGTPNFTFDTVNYYFRVAKRELHVKVEDASTVYGEDAPKFTPAHTGLVKNSSTSDTADSIETALGVATNKPGKTPNFITEYETGMSVGGGKVDAKGRYYIRVDDDRVAYDGALNYFVNYDDAWLTVNQRSVTITIENKTSTFNDKSSVQELTFRVTKKSAYDLYQDQLPVGGSVSEIYTNSNQTLLTLYTKALVKEKVEGEDGKTEEVWNTNHVYYVTKEDGSEVIGGYTIYAVFNGGNKTNYAVTFDSCETVENGSGVTKEGQEPIGINSVDTVNNAGLYVIERAHVDIISEGVNHYNNGEKLQSNYYSGAENFYEAYLDDPYKTPIEFTYLQSQNGKREGNYVAMGEGKKPVEVGWYRAVGTSTSKDYYNGSMTMTFQIEPAQIELKAYTATVQYGTYLSGNVEDDNEEGGAQQTGLFKGFYYDVTPRPGHDLLDEILAPYKDRGSGAVTYKTGYQPDTPAGTKDVEITPVCASTKNITFIPMGATLTIERRQIEVTVVGWDDKNSEDPSKHNALASSPYLGKYEDLKNALAMAYSQNMSKFIYVDPNQDTFGASGDSFEALNITLTLSSGAKEVGVYSMSHSGEYSSNNYLIKFLDDGAPKFAVLKASLTLYANSMQKTGVAQKYTNIIYGESISTYVSSGYETASDYDGKHYDKTLRFEVRGMVYDEVLTTYLIAGQVQFTITLKDDPAKTPYVAWESTVDQTYVVSVVPLGDVFENYIIATYVDAELSISQRTVTAAISNQDRKFSFGEDATEFHGGSYGMNHVAEITFADAVKGENGKVNTDYRPKFTLWYTPATGAQNYEQTAPTKVGEYNVKVALNEGSNYKFAGGDSSVLLYRIIPMTVTAGDLTWADSPIHVSDKEDEKPTETVFNIINKYQSGYLQVTNFLFEPVSGPSTDLTEGQEDGCYYFDDSGRLCIKLDPTKQIYGRYTVRIELLSTATHNIQLISGTDDVTFITATFVVTTDKVTMEVSFEDFEYGSNPDFSKILSVTINGTSTTNVSLSYAPIDDKDAQKVQKLYNDSRNGGLSGKAIEGLSYGTLTIFPNFTAGYYLLSVYSAEWATTQYFVFRVTPKEISAPVLETEKQSLSTYYNGKYQTVSVDYNVNDMTPSFKGNMTIAGGSVTFTVLDAATYTIQFVLYDTANTVWKQSDLPAGAKIEEDGITVTYTWTVSKDTTANDGSVVTVTASIDSMVYGEGYKGEVWTATGYNGATKLYYTPKVDGEEAPSGEWKLYYDSETFTYQRLDVGSYWIKVVLLETSNYGEKVAIGQFRINPKEIEASISGTITYGESIYDEEGKSTKFKPVVSGILSGDPAATLGEYAYALAEAYSDSITEAGYLIAGREYYIILVNNDKGEIGITVGDKGNYVIKAVKGLLVVNKRSVTVTITGTSGDYSINPELALADLEYGIDERTPLAPGETKEVLNLHFVTDATVESVVGGVYWITIDSWDPTNYELSYQRASYTVTPLEVEITLDPQTDIVYKRDKVVGATFDAEDLKVSNPNANKNDIIENLRDALRLHYTGTSYAGVYYDSDEHDGKAPVDAGVYTAQVTGAGSNYTLVGVPSVEFTIQKQTVNYEALKIASKTYTGLELTPVLGVKEGESTDILDLVTATIVSYTKANVYQIVVTLNDANNYQWDTTQDAYVTVPFEIIKANDALVGELSIADWAYGCYSADVNSPVAQVKSGSTIIFEYSTDGENFSNIVPDTGSVGVYYVRVVVLESENYFTFTSDPVAFRITKYYLAVPEIVESDGTFTGSELTALISNYDARYMAVMNESEARTFVGATNITAVAVNAGEYKIYISINDFVNCGWLGDVGDNAGVLTLTWKIGKMKVALPTAGKNNFVVNGSEIVYIPEGFDESIMSIANNVQSYGGKFTAVVTLKDTSNYEWADGSTSVKLSWHITGANTVLAVILSLLAVCVAAGVAGLVTQTLLDKRRKRTEAEALAEIENKDLAESETAANAANSEAEKAEDAKEKPEEKPEEKAEEKAEEPPQPKPKQKSGNTSKSKSGKGGKQA